MKTVSMGMTLWLWGSTWRPRPVRLLGLACLLVAFVALLGVLVQANSLQRELAATRAALVQTELAAPRASAAKGTTRVSVVSAAQADALNDAVDQLNVPWAHILNELEVHTPSTIAVLQIEPLVAANVLRWQVEAKSREQVFAYLDRLRKARNLQQARLIKFETNSQDPNRPMRFSLEAVLGVVEGASPSSVSKLKAPGARRGSS